MLHAIYRALLPTVLLVGLPWLSPSAVSAQPTFGKPFDTSRRRDPPRGARTASNRSARWLVGIPVGLLLALSSAPLVASETRADALDCPAIAGADDLFTQGTVLLLGELHGTDQSPAFTLQVACNAAAAGLPVVVGIEVTDAEQGRFDAFLDSSGAAADRDALLLGEIWRMPTQYGVTSEAMLDLVDGLRQLRRGGAVVRVALFNRSASQDGSTTRDHRMAEALATALKTDGAAFAVALTGNLHSRVVVGLRQSPDFEPMGVVLTRLLPNHRVRSLNVAHDGGTAWVCLMDGGCGARTFGANAPDGMEPGIRWAEDPAATGHHGWYGVGALSASPPAFRDAAP